MPHTKPVIGTVCSRIEWTRGTDVSTAAVLC